MEKVKFSNGVTYDLAPGNCFDGQEVSIIFLPGVLSFDAVEADVKAAKTITVLDTAGEPMLTRSGLVYGDYLAKVENYTISTEQVQNGEDTEGQPLYETQDVKATVMIVKFRVPDLSDELEATQARLAYVEMMSGIEMEV